MSRPTFCRWLVVGSTKLVASAQKILFYRGATTLRSSGSRRVMMQSARMEMETEIANVRLRIEQIRAERNKERNRWIRERENMGKKQIHVSEKIQTLMKKDSEINKALHVYADMIKASRGRRNAVPSYVVVLESQLCRVLHHYGNSQCQFFMTKKQCTNMFEWMKRIVVEMVEAKSMVEMNLMNSICLLEDKTNQTKEVYAKIIQDQMVAIHSLEHSIDDTKASSTNTSATPELVRDQEQSLLQVHQLVSLLENVAQSQEAQPQLVITTEKDESTDEESIEIEDEDSPLLSGMTSAVGVAF